ncbi:MAG: DCC1-like thiol-disulfide oxidoreductase family protein [Capnocytophaga sp.]|nr:DCC1-like thiol-disulfide oxidoreductase family protein [Capnocytophaga sp.]
MNKNLLIFDGDCLFCNWIAYYLAKADKRDCFKFVASTSKIGKYIIKENHLENFVNQTVIVKVNEVFYVKSDAVYQFLKESDTYPLLRFLIWITPSFIANFVYDSIAKYRKKLIKKECPILPIEFRRKFL